MPLCSAAVELLERVSGACVDTAALKVAGGSAYLPAWASASTLARGGNRRPQVSLESVVQRGSAW